MLIGELATVTGVSPRALRHYEDRGLLQPHRTSAGYREFEARDVVRVGQIQAMISAGLGTTVIGRYLECARLGEERTYLEMCPDLRAELDQLVERFDREQVALDEQRRALTLIVDPINRVPFCERTC
ncbi:MerR family transcriptional regulator [Luteipulveratus mongoliensis]|uniref:HTH merR-type domain-containing protein n=1 Tax=Luteipulveratus mongoliensis TaxID=571913 RepID=A0A0K1JL23_9MICO|nr:MerR family transcriptional regulator [Luteipulveratus mongoliensis]AKU17273.1 hypothetical protein VV02_17795 [Luteipulveratus mongoliensis]